MKNITLLSSLFIFISLLILLGCSTPTYYLHEKMPPKSISFGSGGGISGKTLEYCLLENGQVLEKKRTIFEQIKKIKKSDAKLFFETLTKVEKLSQSTSDQYFFLTLRQPNQSELTIKWHRRNPNISEDVQKLHQQLMDLTQK
jgi:hypothetical protein